MVKPIEDPEQAARTLMQEAYQRGSADNITCVVVRFLVNKNNNSHHESGHRNNVKQENNTMTHRELESGSYRQRNSGHNWSRSIRNSVVVLTVNRFFRISFLLLFSCNVTMCVIYWLCCVCSYQSSVWCTLELLVWSDVFIYLFIHLFWKIWINNNFIEIKANRKHRRSFLTKSEE